MKSIMLKRTQRLMWRLAAIYAAALAMGTVALTFNNVFLLGSKISALLTFNLPFIGLTDIIMLVLLLAFTRIRLHPVWRDLNEGVSTERREAVVRRLLRLPYEIFWGMLFLCSAGIAAYHLSEMAYFGRSFRDLDGKRLAQLAQNVVAELLLSLLLAVMFFVLLRRMFRNDLSRLQVEALAPERPGTFMLPLLITFGSCYSIVVLSVLRTILLAGQNGEAVGVGVMSGLFLFYFAFGLVIYMLVISQFRGELRELIRGIRELLRGDRSRLHGKMPVLSNDEAGQLVAAFNELQTHIAREYDALDRELRLSYEVQQQLLPDRLHRAGEWRIAAYCRPTQVVGGDLFDIVPLDERRTAVLIGDVSGNGLPAALLMSAVLVLFRSEIRRGGTAGDIVTRLNRMLAETLQGDMYVTLGLAIFDASESVVRYASAGHVSPYLTGPDGVRELPVCSLPGGIDAEAVYREAVFPFRPGDRMVLYTDGIVEAFDREGAMLGFDRLERYVGEMPADAPADELLEWLRGKLPDGASADDDDRTLLIVSRGV